MKKIWLVMVVVGLLAGCSAGPLSSATTSKALARAESPCDPVLERDTLIDTGELQDPRLQSEAYKNRPDFVVLFPDAQDRCVPVGQDSGE